MSLWGPVPCLKPGPLFWHIRGVSLKDQPNRTSKAGRGLERAAEGPPSLVALERDVGGQMEGCPALPSHPAGEPAVVNLSAPVPGCIWMW